MMTVAVCFLTAGTINAGRAILDTVTVLIALAGCQLSYSISYCPRWWSPMAFDIFGAQLETPRLSLVLVPNWDYCAEKLLPKR